MIQGIIAIIVAVIIAILIYFVLKKGIALLINAIVGVVVLFLINVIGLMQLIGYPDVPINWLTILISAIGGFLGVIIVLIMHLLGVSLAV
jgi:hypothetical protein